MTVFDVVLTDASLAVNGGARAVSEALPPMYPGGMRIGAEEEAAVLDVLRSKRLFRYYGPGEAPSKVEELEAAVAEKFGVAHVLAVSSGSIALASSLAALGVGPGDEVIVPAYTWIASAAAVLFVGGVPVIAEVDESLTLDVADVANRITDRTKVILTVHMRGGASDMDGLLELARRHDLRILEDTAQACGASFHGRRLGTIGDIGIFSLQFNKILTSGEGGLVTTNSRSLYERALMFHDVAGSLRASLKETGTFVGTTGRMSELQGAVAGAQLEKLDDILADARRNHAALRAQVAEIATAAGVTWRHQWDPAGDAGIALIGFLPDSARTGQVVTALQSEGVPATRLFNPAITDYHVAYHWDPMIQGRSWSSRTPWDAAPDITRLDPSSCPRTNELLERAIHIDVSPDYTPAQIAQIGHGVNKVLAALLG
ncbi:DegT/DnrJ/EryC1/StrS family aminotransferase [Leifsonia shinshuensis]|uniref:dTDP-4-amino-4,6-dideoxygalactose transaminase n=1 Tax=Leifsonia shinshuensis TaxID=150026 RepID=A0A853D5N1_9MICO|nr:DegT/DnrJ/EryC1/StrS family aminotransferase [Leifsonia shinshuensis]NYJ25935.1 dTDP-4-amino-4,6-dideoxygalactose transaminase [Leifsonia shinshuensis]